MPFSWQFWEFFSTGTYAGIGTKIVSSMKMLKKVHTQKNVGPTFREILNYTYLTQEVRMLLGV